MKREYTTEEIKELESVNPWWNPVTRTWKRTSAGGFNGSSTLLFVCPKCGAACVEDSAILHVSYHNQHGESFDQQFG